MNVCFASVASLDPEDVINTEAMSLMSHGSVVSMLDGPAGQPTKSTLIGSLPKHFLQGSKAATATSLGVGAGGSLGKAHVVAEFVDEARRIAGDRFPCALAS